MYKPMHGKKEIIADLTFRASPDQAETSVSGLENHRGGPIGISQSALSPTPFHMFSADNSSTTSMPLHYNIESEQTGSRNE